MMDALPQQKRPLLTAHGPYSPHAPATRRTHPYSQTRRMRPQIASCGLNSPRAPLTCRTSDEPHSS
eukprot:6213102-Pleurochrysis_carterae.AAC.2